MKGEMRQKKEGSRMDVWKWRWPQIIDRKRLIEERICPSEGFEKKVIIKKTQGMKRSRVIGIRDERMKRRWRRYEGGGSEKKPKWRGEKIQQDKRGGMRGLEEEGDGSSAPPKYFRSPFPKCWVPFRSIFRVLHNKQIASSANILFVWFARIFFLCCSSEALPASCQTVV